MSNKILKHLQKTTGIGEITPDGLDFLSHAVNLTPEDGNDPDTLGFNETLIGKLKTLLEEINNTQLFHKQVGGSHYKEYIIQPYLFFFLNKTPHHKAAIMRRVLRYDHPTGNGLKDIKKCIHELQMIIKLGGLDATT